MSRSTSFSPLDLNYKRVILHESRIFRGAGRAGAFLTALYPLTAMDQAVEWPLFSTSSFGPAAGGIRLEGRDSEGYA